MVSMTTTPEDTWCQGAGRGADAVETYTEDVQGQNASQRKALGEIRAPC